MPLEFNPATNQHTQYIDIPASSRLDLTTKFTLSCWIYLYSWSSGRFSDFISKNNYYGLQLQSNNGGLQVFFRYGSSSWHQAWINSPESLNTWIHALGTYDNSLASDNLKLYRNGILSDSRSFTDTILTSPTDTLSIGRMGAGAPTTDGRYCHGIIDDARVYNRALSANEAATIYGCRGHDAIIDGLLVRCPMNEKNTNGTASGSGSVKDLSSYNSNGTAAGTPVYKDSVLTMRRGQIA
ncbi:MAG: LamG domain-containing protein [Chitinivibrionales bacterium]